VTLVSGVIRLGTRHCHGRQDKPRVILVTSLAPGSPLTMPADQSGRAALLS
jgi:hypothetical protein